MVGGILVALERARPVLQVLDPQPKHLGAVGSAAHTKLVLNQLIASLTPAVPDLVH